MYAKRVIVKPHLVEHHVEEIDSAKEFAIPPAPLNARTNCAEQKH